MLSVAGADHIITMDLHASQIQVSAQGFTTDSLTQQRLAACLRSAVKKLNPSNVNDYKTCCFVAFCYENLLNSWYVTISVVLETYQGQLVCW